MPETVYRMSVYAKRSGSFENALLYPADGAVHNDGFYVSTHNGFASQSYMDTPRGGSGVFQVPDYKLQVGSYNVKLFDIRTNPTGSNLNRWVTAFIGNESSSLSLVGRKAFIEQSNDSGSSWAPVIVGRISEFNMDDPMSFSVTVRDSVDELKAQVFYTLPTVSYANYLTSLPVGLKNPLNGYHGSLTSISQSRIDPVTPFRAGASGYPSPGVVQFGVKASDINSKANDITPLLLQRPPDNAILGSVNQSTFGGGALEGVRCSVAGVGDYLVSQLLWVAKNGPRRPSLIDFTVSELDPLDPAYAPTSSITIGQDYEFVLYSPRPQEDKPLWLYASPRRVAEDMLNGAFSTTLDGTRLSLPFIFDTGSLPISSSTSFAKQLFRIEQPMTAIQFLEDYICKPYQVGMAIEPVVIDNVPRGQVRFFTTKLPDHLLVSSSLSSSIQTITETMVIAGSGVSWQPGKPIRRFTGTYYIETPLDVADQLRNNTAATDIEVVRDYDYPVILLDIADTESGDDSFTIDFNGIRGIARLGSGGTSNAALLGMPLETFLASKVAEYLNEFADRFSTGPITVELACSTDQLPAVKVGDYVLVEVQALPNPALRTRGGTRLMQILGLSINGLTTRLTLLDSGAFEAHEAPLDIQITSQGDNRVRFDIVTSELVQVNLQQVSLRGATCGPLAGVPENDSRWATRTTFLLSGSGSTVLNDVPAGGANHFRIRSETPVGELYRLPSAWTRACFTHPVINPPTDIVVSDISRRSANLTWTNQSTGSVEIFLASGTPPAGPTSNFTSQVAELPALSTNFPLRGLDLNTSPSHSVYLRYRKDYGGYSQFASASFIAESSGSMLPDLDPLIVYVGA